MLEWESESESESESGFRVTPQFTTGRPIPAKFAELELFALKFVHLPYLEQFVCEISMINSRIKLMLTMLPDVL